MKCAQDLVNGKLSEIMKIVSKEQVTELFGIELSYDQDIDNYLKYEYQWPSNFKISENK